MKNKTFRMVGGAIEWFIRHRVLVVSFVMVITTAMAYLAAQIEVKTVFSDLLPRNHQYIKINDQFKQTFGGSNMISIMLETEEGDVFQMKVLERVQKITKALQQVSNVDSYQIVSLASKKIKEVRASTDGIESRPLMWPNLPKDETELKILKESVLNNPLVFGAYVSLDMKATLITVDFVDAGINYSKIYDQITEITDAAAGDGIKVRIVGEPLLYGIVGHYLTETLHLFLVTVATLVALLFLITRSWHGTILPLSAGALSAIWALGAAKLMGFHLDPLPRRRPVCKTCSSLACWPSLPTRVAFWWSL
jgi:hypothetical protein